VAELKRDRAPDTVEMQAVGKPRPGFTRGDPNETRNQQGMLEAEGGRFPNGAADPSRHLDAAALAVLVEQE
jgi:hypothetical protein